MYTNIVHFEAGIKDKENEFQIFMFDIYFIKL